jgi:hypothetical protein
MLYPTDFRNTSYRYIWGIYKSMSSGPRNQLEVRDLLHASAVLPNEEALTSAHRIGGWVCREESLVLLCHVYVLASLVSPFGHVFIFYSPPPSRHPFQCFLVYVFP